MKEGRKLEYPEKTPNIKLSEMVDLNLNLNLNLFISRMTVLGHGLIFQPVLASLHYT